jgi:hypothetical protein
MDLMLLLGAPVFIVIFLILLMSRVIFSGVRIGKLMLLAFIFAAVIMVYLRYRYL